MPFQSFSREGEGLDASTPRASAQSTLLRSAPDVRLYALAVVDQETGQVLREASAADARRAAALLQRQTTTTTEPTPVPSLQALLAEYSEEHGGRIECLHCHVNESPQWRRGPAEKPILCNACGTRFRRTGQLGAAVPSQRIAGPAKRSGASSCARDASQHAGGGFKQTRVAAMA